MSDTLNAAKAVGVLGCFIALARALYSILMVEAGKVFEYYGLETLYWPLSCISYIGYFSVAAFPFIVVGLFTSAVLYEELPCKMLMLLAGVVLLAATVMTMLWAFPYGSALIQSSDSSSLELTLEELANVELLWSQSSFLTVLSMFFAGLTGIVGKEPDRTMLVGYIIAFVGGLAGLVVAVIGSTSLFPGLGGVDWIPLAAALSSIAIIGLMPVFFRSISYKTVSKSESTTSAEE